MRVTIRRIGNSLGVIIPKATLDRWGVREGDVLELKDDRIVPVARGFSKDDLNQLRLARAAAIIREFSPREIRAKGLANLHRWKAHGAWVKAYDEWEEILRDPDDGRLFAAMLGRDEHSVRLRQSPPYVGLLSPEQVKAMNEEVPA
jgi:antitoxin component of MazEF toxin-antitoxin module